MKKIRVGILFGGRSGEHEVSLLSAKEVIAAIDQTRYDIIPIGITKQGEWLQAPIDSLNLLAKNNIPVSLLPDPQHQALLAVTATKNIDKTQTLQQLDVVFPLIHGTYGEDGCIQGLLELANIPYVGAGVLGSALGMDKVLMKTVLKQAGLPITDFYWTTRKQWRKNPEEIQDQIEKQLHYPLFVKPANLGSSVGISKVHTSVELPAAMSLACQFDRKIIIESGVPQAREIEVAVLGNDELIASIPGEIFPSREFYDYAAKYLDNNSRIQIPADLSESLAHQLQTMAKTAFRAINCEGLARVDFLINAENSAVYISELNTLPGFTRISMYPKMFEKSGISYAELINKLIQLAFERHKEVQENITSFEPPMNTIS